MAEQFIEDIRNIVAQHLRARYSEEEYGKIRTEIKKITRIVKKSKGKKTQDKQAGAVYSHQELDRLLSGINEKQELRKVRGVYYTPEDVVQFILKNSICLLFGKDYGTKELEEEKKREFAYKRTVFDPTCGTGEFLMAVLKEKFAYVEESQQDMSAQEIFLIVKTVFGNDINEESVVILKLRMFLFLLEKFGIKKIEGISRYLNRQFWTYDYLNQYSSIKKKVDLVIGNPPYVEDKKAQTNGEKKYGNIYANVLIYSADHLKRDGVMGYIIPLSYVSTPRMQGIREDLVQKMKVQWLFHFSDRPDCLFTAVHQKLTILIAKKARRKHERICTSSYQYWYRAGREQLFEKLELFPNTWKEEKFIPKIGNEIEERIYRKVRGQAVPLADFMKRGGDFPVYLNLRAAFWMKVFTTVHQGADYRTYGFVDRGEQMYAMCILNSSLFWWFWVCVSDCWHITAKEFETFRIPEIFDNRIVENLATDLEQRLEETKVHIGSKQTEYEYKHKDCLAQIDRIDAYVGGIFGLTEEEKNYISQFARKYRISRGAEDETD